MLKQPSGRWDIENLDLYYRDCVIGGPGAFMIPVRERHQLTEAIKTKIVREISDLPGAATQFKRAQAEVLTNCLAGEARMRP